MTTETITRWRLILGGDDADGTGASLSGEAAGMDAALSALYEFERKKKFEYPGEKGRGGSGKSQPSLARWLGDIRRYFPQSVVQVIQNDALREPELQRKLMPAQTWPDTCIT